ncbi:MAG: zinc-ribbon domain-containing protein [Paracoccaceae bacterium]
MRLTCPNCGATYEVPEDAIPEGGRDVQCSACGHGWFAAGPGGDFAAGGMAAPARVAPGDAARPDGAAGAVPEPDGPQNEPPVEGPRPRELDPAVARILREEAEREVQARAQEDRAPAPPPPAPAASSVTATTPPDRSATEDRTSPARAAAIAAAAAPVVAPAADEGVSPARPKEASRAARLPKVEQVEADRPGDRSSGRGAAREFETPISQLTEAEQAEARRRRGFRIGFGAVMVAAGLLVWLYVAAPWLSERIPGAAPVLERYSAAVDRQRAGFDGWVQGLVAGETP